MKIRVQRSAGKQLARLHPDDARRVVQKLRVLEKARTLHEAPLDIRPLTNNEGYRLRIGTIRVIFHMKENEVVIVSINSRGKAYKR